MEKNYETFVNNLRERLLKATGYQEEMICYKTAEEYPPTDGDRLLLKNRQREGVYEVCALYVADLYEWHQNGATMERIVQEIMHRLDAIVRSECFEKSKDLEDYEKIKDDLFIRLLNVEKNSNNTVQHIGTCMIADHLLSLCFQSCTEHIVCRCLTIRSTDYEYTLSDFF